MVHDIFWFLHLHLRDEQGTYLLHLLLFVPCYTVSPVTRMNSVVRHHVFSDKSVVSVGQAVYLSWSCPLQFWSICSVVCQSSSPNGQSADSTICSFLCMCAYHRLCSVLSLVIITCSGTLLLTWNHKRFGNGGLFLVAQISTWLLVAVCAPCFASVSACSFPGTPQWAGIH